MKVDIIETENPSIRLIEPDIERDSQLGVSWINGELGRRTLELMGVTDSDNIPTTIDKERIRIKDFIERNDQLNWMIELKNQVIGSIWVDLEPTDELPAPAIHIMIGDPSARGQGVGNTVTKAVVNYLREQGNSKIYSRALASNEAAANLLAQNDFKQLDKPYADKDGLIWQNVILDLS